MKKILVLIIGILCSYNAISQSAITYNNRGVNKFATGDYKNALLDYNKAIELNPKDASVYYNRGFAKANLGIVNEACLDWSKAGEMGYWKAYDTIKKYCN